MATDYIVCEPELQSMTVVKYTYDPLEKYKVYNWSTGYIWKQGRVIQFKVLDLHPEHRHHAACLMGLQAAANHLLSYLLNNGIAPLVQRIWIYMSTCGHDGQLCLTAEAPLYTGRPSWFPRIHPEHTSGYTPTYIVLSYMLIAMRLRSYRINRP